MINSIKCERWGTRQKEQGSGQHVEEGQRDAEADIAHAHVAALVALVGGKRGRRTNTSSSSSLSSVFVRILFVLSEDDVAVETLMTTTISLHVREGRASESARDFTVETEK